MKLYKHPKSPNKSERHYVRSYKIIHQTGIQATSSIYDDIQQGDLVDFGQYGQLYVCDPYYSDKYFWVTDEEDERLDRSAQGWSILKDLAKRIIEPYTEYYEDEDYYEDSIESSDEVSSIDSIKKAISGDKKSILQLESEGYTIRPASNPLSYNEVGTYDVIDPDGHVYTYDNTVSYHAKSKMTVNSAEDLSKYPKSFADAYTIAKDNFIHNYRNSRVNVQIDPNDYYLKENEVSLYISGFNLYGEPCSTHIVFDLGADSNNNFTPESIYKALVETARDLKIQKGYWDAGKLTPVHSSDNSLDTDTIINDIKSDILQKVHEIMLNKIGLKDSEIDDYVFVDVSFVHAGANKEEAIKVEVRAEVSYEDLNQLCEYLDPIVDKYDKHAYFEPVDPGIIESYIFIDRLNKESIKGESTDELLNLVDQEYTSENTSINKTKLPAVYKMIHLDPGDVVVDFGGGKWDTAVEHFAKEDITICVYDPYNRSSEHNRDVLRILRENGGADVAINSNVLNVIKEPEARRNVLENISQITKPGAPIYITVYEGRGDGKEGPTKSGYQLNRKTADYLQEIQEVFPDATRKGKLIIAHNNR